MIKIGIVGEDPHDTDSIRNLLTPWLQGRAQISSLLRNRRGGQLDHPKTRRMLTEEVQSEKPAIVIVVRDADCTSTDAMKLESRREWYRKITADIAIAKILLLNIYELEALILADIESFNKLYGVAIKPQGDVSMKADPKGILKQKTDGQRKKFQESACPEIFKELDIALVQKNCKYFRDFLAAFEEELSGIEKQY